jgi:hypothetical protein
LRSGAESVFIARMNLRRAATFGLRLSRASLRMVREERFEAATDAARWAASFFGRDAEATAWIPYPAQRWLAATVTPTMAVFEYGGGFSTVYLASKAGHVTTVEHDHAWHARLSLLLAERGCEDVTLLHVPPVFTGERPQYGVDSYSSYAAGFEGASFAEYVRTIDRFADESLHLVIVDGRARASCVAHARRKLRPGGFLLLDDSERAAYACVLPLLDGYLRIDFFGLKARHPEASQTTVWQKP